MFPERLSTERLRFEQFCHDTISARELYTHASHVSPTIDEETEYLPWDPLRTVKDADERIDRFEALWEAGDRAEWVITPNESEDGAGDVAGSAGLIFQWEKDLALLAIWLRKPFWGREYSGERADALLTVAFEYLDVGVVAIPIHSENAKSYRAVSKYVDRHGGRYEGVLRNHAGRYDQPADHHRFSISQDEFRNADGTGTSLEISDPDRRTPTTVHQSRAAFTAARSDEGR